jgi:serine/threonine protein kinase
VIGKFGPFEFTLSERYRFEEELGRGAMGTVYRAKDVRLGRPVAIKILHPALTNELGVSRFQSEIRIAASLHHPNIVGVHESGEADGRLFYVMDYLGGETLRARLKREKQLSPEDALKIVDDLAEGLQYAHDHGVVHRDVKPENIILAEDHACLVDFGLALALGDVDAQRLTASGLSVGTPHYLSPEQASAEREIGPRADQYALACVLFEMLVGEPPFTGPTASFDCDAAHLGDTDTDAGEAEDGAGGSRGGSASRDGESTGGQICQRKGLRCCGTRAASRAGGSGSHTPTKIPQARGRSCRRCARNRHHSDCCIQRG